MKTVAIATPPPEDLTPAEPWQAVIDRLLAAQEKRAAAYRQVDNSILPGDATSWLGFKRKRRTALAEAERELNLARAELDGIEDRLRGQLTQLLSDCDRRRRELEAEARRLYSEVGGSLFTDHVSFSKNFAASQYFAATPKPWEQPGVPHELFKLGSVMVSRPRGAAPQLSGWTKQCQQFLERCARAERDLADLAKAKPAPACVVA